jgi:hypothetical protein
MELHKFKEDYLRTNDPTEYFFVVKYIGTWDLWESMCNDINYKPIIESWRRELEAKIKSDAMSRILEAARGETRDALQANKFLLDSPWIKEANGRGRPSKQEVASEANKIAMEEQRITQDYKRVVEDDAQQ